jgi:hypothetical protein
LQVRKQSTTSNDCIPILYPKLADDGKLKGFKWPHSQNQGAFCFFNIRSEGLIYPILVITAFTTQGIISSIQPVPEQAGSQHSQVAKAAVPFSHHGIGLCLVSSVELS